jgi:hypothetical protein
MFMLHGTEVYLDFSAHYSNGRICIQVLDKADDSPWGKLTVNMPEAELEENEFCIKNWSENVEMAAGAFSTGRFEDTGRSVQSGFISAPIWRLKL